MCCEEKDCEKQGQPKDCPPEKIKECHGEAGEHPCDPKGCEKPEELKEKKKCCGDAQDQPKTE